MTTTSQRRWIRLGLQALVVVVIGVVGLGLAWVATNDVGAITGFIVGGIVGVFFSAY